MAMILILLAYALVAVVDVTRAAVCVPTWEKSDDTRSFSGSSDELPGVKDVDKCKSGCIARTNCLGFDFKKKSKQCWVHKNAKDFKVKHVNEGIDQYTVTRCPSSECNSTPCRNNGTCADKGNSYTCSCVLGFAGMNCETDVNKCDSSPCQNGGTCSDGINKYTCTCASPCFSGTNCETDSASTKYSLPQAAANTTKITIPSFAGTTTVQTVNGWIVIQQQFELSPIFFADWSTYKTGFGIYNCNFWLGLEKIYQLTSSSQYMLRIDFLLVNGTWISAKYNNFYIENEQRNYTIHVSEFSGKNDDIMNSEEPANGMPFSTYDRGSLTSCAADLKSGFWFYKTCGTIYINNNKGWLVYCYPSCQTGIHYFLVSRLLIQQV